MATELIDPTKLSIGVFFGLQTRQRKIRLQRRTEEGSILAGKSFKGDWELPGGRAKERDLKELLTSGSLFDEGFRAVKEDLGVKVFYPEALFDGPFPVYRAVFVNQAEGTTDWAFAFGIPWDCWEETDRMKRETIDVTPDEVRELACQPKGQQLLGGWGKRMCRMALGSFVMVAHPAYTREVCYAGLASKYLDSIKPGWKRNEYFRDHEKARKRFSRQLHLEQ